MFRILGARLEVITPNLVDMRNLPGHQRYAKIIACYRSWAVFDLLNYLLQALQHWLLRTLVFLRVPSYDQVHDTVPQSLCILILISNGRQLCRVMASALQVILIRRSVQPVSNNKVPL